MDTGTAWVICTAIVSSTALIMFLIIQFNNRHR